MSLTELIAGVEDHEMTLTVYNADSGVADDLRERFADRNLVVAEGETDDGPREYLVLSEGEQFLTATAVDEVFDRGDDSELHFDGEQRSGILDHLDETMFTSYDPGQMVAASREIEDRAWRIGAGQLHAGFQHVSTIEGEMDVYEQLATKRDLDVHAYGYPDTGVPDHEGFTIHVERTDEIATTWFVVYDGAGVDSNKCALLAEEREPREFYGFWTYDPSTVDWIVDHLVSTYGLVETDDGVSQ
jgi:DICT domain-containing protein